MAKDERKVGQGGSWAALKDQESIKASVQGRKLGDNKSGFCLVDALSIPIFTPFLFFLLECTANIGKRFKVFSVHLKSNHFNFQKSCINLFVKY